MSTNKYETLNQERKIQKMKKKVAAYCRVSTDNEDQANSFESQQRYFRQYIERNPDWELYEIFADEGISGTNTKKRKEFNRMIRLESLMYGIKSLIIGIPLGVLGVFAIFSAFSKGSVPISFVFPWKAILISIAAVFIVVWLIMKYSISKVNKQNIIETIRNDNI